MDIISKKYTIETRIDRKSDLVNYIDEYIGFYSSCYFTAWKLYSNRTFKTDGELKKHLMCKYNLKGRTVNSILVEVKTNWKAHYALIKTNLQAIELKILRLEKDIGNLKADINKAKKLVTDNKLSAIRLNIYRERKAELFRKQKKLDRLRKKKVNLELAIKNYKVSICFGSKKLFKQQFNIGNNNNSFKSHAEWRRKFRRERSKNIFFVGTSTETCGNQMCQLRYNIETDDFTLKLRKDFILSSDEGKSEEEIDKYITQQVNFTYMREHLIKLCLFHQDKDSENRQPLTYRLRRLGTAYYIQVTFDVRFSEYNSTAFYGTIGLDYNDGLIVLAETDRKGNLVRIKEFELQYHGTGNKAKLELQSCIKKIVEIAKENGKDIIAEDLDFKAAKAKCFEGKSEKGKKYNRMIHTLDYKRFREVLEYACHRGRIRVEFKKPYYTTKVAKLKYNNRMKLSSHQGAAFVIARIGLGYDDRKKLKLE